MIQCSWWLAGHLGLLILFILEYDTNLSFMTLWELDAVDSFQNASLKRGRAFNAKQTTLIAFRCQFNWAGHFGFTVEGGIGKLGIQSRIVWGSLYPEPRTVPFRQVELLCLNNIHYSVDIVNTHTKQKMQTLYSYAKLVLWWHTKLSNAFLAKQWSCTKKHAL